MQVIIKNVFSVFICLQKPYPHKCKNNFNVFCCCFFQLEARRRALEASLTENNTVELAKELSKQQQQRDEFNEKKAKEIEDNTLMTGLEVTKLAIDEFNFIIKQVFIHC